MPPSALRQGDIYLCDFRTPPGHEQHGLRPAVVIANEPYHLSIPRMTIVVALTSANRNLPHHIEIPPDPVNGLRCISYAITEQPKAVSLERLSGDRQGVLAAQPLGQILGYVQMFIQQESFRAHE
ncbi:MAG: type II toxin-antitoxin system PemK/MazF family toxin [Mycobacteriales bacterium]